MLLNRLVIGLLEREATLSYTSGTSPGLDGIYEEEIVSSIPSLMIWET
jgi:hypothetical protein